MVRADALIERGPSAKKPWVLFRPGRTRLPGIQTGNASDNKFYDFHNLLHISGRSAA